VGKVVNYEEPVHAKTSLRTIKKKRKNKEEGREADDWDAESGASSRRSSAGDELNDSINLDESQQSFRIVSPSTVLQNFGEDSGSGFGEDGVVFGEEEVKPLKVGTNKKNRKIRESER